MNRPLIVDWKGLKELGWPYSRAHTWRLMDGGWEKTNGEWYAVQHPFPRCQKLGNGSQAHPVWRYADVLAYFEKHGLLVSAD